MKHSPIAKSFCKIATFVVLGYIIYFGLLPAIASLEELSTKECVTSSDCKRLFANDSTRQHCETGIYKCVKHCSPTRHENTISRYPEPIRKFIFETSDVWKKLNAFCKGLTALCGVLMAWVASWATIVRSILKSPLFVIAAILAIPWMQELIKLLLPHELIDKMLTWAMVRIQKFKQSLPSNRRVTIRNAEEYTEDDDDDSEDNKEGGLNVDDTQPNTWHQHNGKNDKAGVKSFISMMDQNDVAAWLEFVFGNDFCCKTNIKQIFQDNYINGQVLLSFDTNMLKDLNVGNAIQQKRFYLEIENLRKMKCMNAKLVHFIQEQRAKRKNDTTYQKGATCLFFAIFFAIISLWVMFQLQS